MKTKGLLDYLRSFFSRTNHEPRASQLERDGMKIIRQGMAMRVIFFYPGEEGTYVDHAEVVLYENGIVHINSNQEETTTHLQNCEILWRFETEADERVSKVRLLKPKTENRNSDDDLDSSPMHSIDKGPDKGKTKKTPDRKD